VTDNRIHTQPPHPHSPAANWPQPSIPPTSVTLVSLLTHQYHPTASLPTNQAHLLPTCQKRPVKRVMRKHELPAHQCLLPFLTAPPPPTLPSSGSTRNTAASSARRMSQPTLKQRRSYASVSCLFAHRPAHDTSHFQALCPHESDLTLQNTHPPLPRPCTHPSAARSRGRQSMVERALPTRLLGCACVCARPDVCVCVCVCFFWSDSRLAISRFIARKERERT